MRGDINGYIPGRAAATIRLEEVLAAFRSTDIEIAHGATSPVLRELVGELDEGAAAPNRRADHRRSDAADATAGPRAPPDASAPRPARDASAPLAIVKDGPGE